MPTIVTLNLKFYTLVVEIMHCLTAYLEAGNCSLFVILCFIFFAIIRDNFENNKIFLEIHYLSIY